MLRRGTIISVDAVSGDWVRIDAPGGSSVLGSDAVTAAPKLGSFDADKHSGGWMLTDGKIMNLGTLLQAHIIELPAGTRWQVTRAGGCRGYTQPGGYSGEGVEAGRTLCDCTEGASVEVLAESGHGPLARVDLPFMGGVAGRPTARAPRPSPPQTVAPCRQPSANWEGCPTSIVISQ